MTQSGGFSATASWPILEEQKWTFVPQGNSTYTIVNAKNSMRVLAQTGMDWDKGFFVVNSGPIYEDHKWRLDPQKDGSYGIMNMRSSRRLIAQKGGEGVKGFAAVRGDGAVREQERWWIINQEKDETGKWLLQLQSEQRKNERLGEQFKLKIGEIISMKSELKTDRDKFAMELEASQRETTKVKERMQVEKKVNMALAEEVVRVRNETERARSDLQVVNVAKSALAAKINVAHTEVQSLSLQMQLERSAAKVLAEEAGEMQSLLGWVSNFSVDDPLHMYKFALLAAALIIMTILRPFRKG